MKYSEMDWGTMEAVVNKLGGMNGVKRFLKYSEMDWSTVEAVVNKLGGMSGVKRLLSGELVIKTVIWTDRIWSLIKIGRFKNVDEIRKGLKNANCNISDWANDLLNKITVSVREEEFELVNISLLELGFKNDTARKDVYEQALKSGLELCPAEVGPQVALQFGSQFKNSECFVIGMEPIIDSHGNLSMFSIKCHGDGGLCLHTKSGRPDYIWYPNNRFIFQRRKKLVLSHLVL